VSCNSGFASLWIVFLSSARSDPSSPKYKSPALPFHFTGGLAFPPSTTGFAMSILGIFGVVLQFALYPRVNARFGLVRSFQYSLFIFPIAYFLAPYLALLPSTSEAPYQATGPWVWVGISVILFLQVAARTFALPTTIILLNNCSPHPSVLGTIHGLGSSVSSTFRTVGPIASGKWYAMGLEQGIIGLGWWGITIISLVGCVSGFLVKNGTGWEIKLPGEEEEEAREEKRSS
jgi:MFS family permease